MISYYERFIFFLEYVRLVQAERRTVFFLTFVKVSLRIFPSGIIFFFFLTPYSEFFILVREAIREITCFIAIVAVGNRLIAF